MPVPSTYKLFEERTIVFRGAGFGEESILAVSDDFLGASGVGGDDRNAQRHRFDDDAAKRLRLNGAVDQRVQCAQRRVHFLLEGNERYSIFKTVSFDQVPEFGLEPLLFIEGVADENEAAGRVFGEPSSGDFDEELLALPRRETSHNANDGFILRQRKLSPKRGAIDSAVFLQRNTVVNRANPRFRNSSFR